MNGAEKRSNLVRRRDRENAFDLEEYSPGSLGRYQSLFTWEHARCVLHRNKYLILACAGILAMSVTLVAFLMRDVYQPIARLEIDPPNSGVKSIHETTEYSAEDNQDYLDTQVQILQSDSLAVKVIRMLHLDQKKEFGGSGGGSSAPVAPPKDAKRAAKQPPSTDAYVLDQIDLANRTPEESSALAALKKRLTVTPVRGTRLIEVSFTSHDTQLAQLVTNTLVRQYIDQNHSNRYTSTMEASEWLSTQIDDLRDKMERSNVAVAEYQKRFNLVEVDDRDVPMGDLMNGVSHQLSDAEANRIEAEAYVRMLDAGQSETIPAFRDDQVYQNLATRYAEVRAQLAEARAVYGDENANVKKLNDQSDELAAQVDFERKRMVNRLRTAYQAAVDREKMMLESREKLRAQMGDASSHLVEYRVLKNEALANAELYNTLQARLREAGIYAGLGSDNIHIVDLAPELHRASAPNRQLIIAMGTLFGCLFAVVLAFVRESFDTTVRTPDDITDSTGLPSLAIIPSLAVDNQNGARISIRSLLNAAPSRPASSNGPSKILWLPAGSIQAEALRDLRTTLLLLETTLKPRVILVSSASSGEGKSTVAANLAAALAQHGETCLVDADLRRPVSGNGSATGTLVGLSQILEGKASIEETFVRPAKIPGLTILPSGPTPSNPADVIESDAMLKLIGVLRQRFDQIVIDSPPAIQFSDARFLSSLADAVILVSCYRSTTRRALTRCLQLMEEVHAPVVGVVLNRMDVASADFQYFNYGQSAKWNGHSNGISSNGTGSGSTLPNPRARAKAASA